MTPERWAEVDRVFGLACEAPMEERDVIVARACGDDHGLREEVMSLLAADAEAQEEGAFLGVVTAAANALAGSRTGVTDLLWDEDHDASPDVGTLVADRFRVDAHLGGGGMGWVVAATELETGAGFALKLMRPSMVASDRARERFVREAKAAARLESRHIARIYDSDITADGVPFIVMELLEGCDLQQLLQERGALPEEEVVSLGVQACQALAVAHTSGIVHRDIKPANLFVATRAAGPACLKLVDFGVSKAPAESSEVLTVSNEMVGSPAYMSPEQLRSSRDVDGRTDIWSLGVVLHELAHGVRPFEGKGLPELMVAIRSGTRQATEDGRVTPALSAVIDRCLAIAPEDRFATASELAASLRAIGDDPVPRFRAVWLVALLIGVCVAVAVWAL